MEAIKQGHDALVKELKHQIAGLEEKIVAMSVSHEETLSLEEGKRVDAINNAVEKAVANSVAYMETSQAEIIERARANYEALANAQLQDRLDEAAEENSIKTKEAIIEAVAKAEHEFKSKEECQRKIDVDGAVEIAIVNAKAAFLLEKEDEIRKAVSETALEARIQREKDIRTLRRANEEAMVVTVLDMVKDMDTEFMHKEAHLNMIHELKVKHLMEETKAESDLKIETLEKDKKRLVAELCELQESYEERLSTVNVQVHKARVERESIEATLREAKTNYQQELADALAHASEEASTASREAEEAVAQIKKDMAERAIKLREAMAARSAQEHSQQLEAALSAATVESTSKIASLEDDLQKNRIHYDNQMHNLAESSAMKLAEASAKANEELQHAYNELKESKEEFIISEKQHKQDVDALTDELRVLRKSLSETQSELADAAIPLGESKRLRTELAECKKRFAELKQTLDKQLSLDEGSLLREAAKVAGHHNKKQKIHFIEKLQEQHRQLQKKNTALNSEVARLKMEQYRSIEATVHSTLRTSNGKENALNSPSAKRVSKPVFGSRSKRSYHGLHGISKSK